MSKRENEENYQQYNKRTKHENQQSRNLVPTPTSVNFDTRSDSNQSSASSSRSDYRGGNYNQGSSSSSSDRSQYHDSSNYQAQASSSRDNQRRDYSSRSGGHQESSSYNSGDQRPSSGYSSRSSSSYRDNQREGDYGSRGGANQGSSSYNSRGGGQGSSSGDPSRSSSGSGSGGRGNYPPSNDRGQPAGNSGGNQAGSSNQVKEITVRSNYFRMAIKRTFEFSSLSITCAEDTEEWSKLTEDAKGFIKRALQIDRFRAFIFFKIRKETNKFNDSFEGFPICEGSIIISLTKFESETFNFNYVNIRNGETRIIPLRVAVTHMRSLSLNDNLSNLGIDTKLEQALGVCLSALFSKLKMIQLGTAAVEKVGKEIKSYLIRNGVVPTFATFGGANNGVYLGLTFKRKVTSVMSMKELLENELRYSNQHEVAEKFKGMSIVYNNQSYVIRNIDFNQNPTHSFKASPKFKTEYKRSADDITYLEYYHLKHGKTIVSKNQPLILVLFKMKNQKKVENYLIPELCYLSGISKRDIHSISREMTHKSVRQKNEFVSQLVGKLNSTDLKETLGDITEYSPLKSGANVISPPTIKGARLRGINWDVSENTVSDILNQNSNQNRNRKWAIVYEKSIDLVHKFTDNIGYFRLPREEFKVELNHIEKQNWDQIDYVFLLLQSENKQNYSYVKRFFNCQVGIPSQCLVCCTGFNKKVKNCVIQMAAKVGGFLWDAENPFAEDAISTCGVEIQRKGRNIKGSVCMSLNSRMTIYYSKTFQTDMPETLTQIVKAKIDEGIEVFKKRCKIPPKRMLIYYRGGDLDLSQFEKVYESTEICMIAVNVDSNTRFTTLDDDNPKVGTVVKSMSRFNTEEFYMNSTSIPSNFGQSKPVRYEIKYKSDYFVKRKSLNSSVIDLDRIIELTFLQTHLYYNWFGSVKLPACLLYAKKAIETRDVTGADCVNILEKLPYYL